MNNPQPLFSNGTVVQYNDEKKAQFKKYIMDNPDVHMGYLPMNSLYICSNPIWSNTHNTYMYHYEYGYGRTSEGTALETDILLCNDRLKLF